MTKKYTSGELFGGAIPSDVKDIFRNKIKKKKETTFREMFKWNAIETEKRCPFCSSKKMKRIDLGTFTFKQYRCQNCNATITVE